MTLPHFQAFNLGPIAEESQNSYNVVPHSCLLDPIDYWL